MGAKACSASSVLGVGGVQLLCPAPPGISGEKLKGVRLQRQGLAAHGRKALGGGQVTADVQHVMVLLF